MTTDKINEAKTCCDESCCPAGEPEDGCCDETCCAPNALIEETSADLLCC
jgi:hypothetical protein